jgi:hypothetical protein
MDNDILKSKKGMATNLIAPFATLVLAVVLIPVTRVLIATAQNLTATDTLILGIFPIAMGVAALYAIFHTLQGGK